MRLAWRIARASIVGRPSRTLFSIAGVALGIATVVAVFTLDHTSVLARTRLLDVGFGADLEVRPVAELADPRAELLRLEGVAGVAAFFENDVRFRPAELASGDDRLATVHLVGLEAGQGPSLGVYFVDAGSDLDPSGDHRDALIGRALAERHGLAPGDRIVLAPPAQAARRACIDGVVQVLDDETGARAEEVLRVAGVLAYEGIGRKSKGEVVLLEYQAARRLLSDVHIETQYWLRRDESIGLESLESGLAKSFAFERNRSSAVGQMADERAFRNGVRMAGLFALLLGLFVIFHTLSMSLVERAREVGVLFALGTTRAGIARIFFAEALVVAMLAGALGFAGGIALAAFLLHRGITTLGVVGHPVGPLEIPWNVVVPLSALGIVVALAGSVFPILRARGTHVVGALRGEDLRPSHEATRDFHVFAALLLAAVVPAFFFFVAPVLGAADARLVQTVLIGLFVLALVMALPLFASRYVGALAGLVVRPFAGVFTLAARLASRSVTESPTRVGASVAALALVTAAFVALHGMTASLRGEIVQWGRGAIVDKVFVEGLPGASVAELGPGLHALPEVLGIEPGDARAFVSFLLLGLPAAELVHHGPLARDAALASAFDVEPSIVISGRLARQRELVSGDHVLLNTSGYGIVPFRVLAVADDYGYFLHPDERAYGVVSERWLTKYFCVDSTKTTQLALRMEPGASAAGAIELLAARFPGARLDVNSGREVLQIHLHDIGRDFVLFDVILLLTGMLAGLGVLNGQLLAALERWKETGVLRALGASGGQIAGAVLLESLALGVVGGILGLGVGVALTPVVVSSLRLLSGLDLPLVLAARESAIACAGAVVLALGSGLYPALRACRFDAVRAVRAG